MNLRKHDALFTGLKRRRERLERTIRRERRILRKAKRSGSPYTATQGVLTAAYERLEMIRCAFERLLRKGQRAQRRSEPSEPEVLQ